MDLYIVGAGNMGGFIAYHAEEMGSSVTGGFEIKGFLDDNRLKHGSLYCGYPVLGGVELLADNELLLDREVAVVVAVARPRLKRLLVERLKQNRLLRFPSLVHPRAWISKHVVVGEGSIIYPGACINYESVLGSFVAVNMNAVVGHNCEIGDYCTLSPGVLCGGGTVIEPVCFMGIGSISHQNMTIIQGTTVPSNTTISKHR